MMVIWTRGISKGKKGWNFDPHNYVVWFWDEVIGKVTALINSDPYPPISWKYKTEPITQNPSGPKTMHPLRLLPWPTDPPPDLRKKIKNVPTKTQDWINTICHDTASQTISIVVATAKNGLGNARAPVWTSYHDVVDGTNSISFQTNSPRSKYPNKEALGLS